jgi:hypothetical protein
MGRSSLGRLWVDLALQHLSQGIARSYGLGIVCLVFDPMGLLSQGAHLLDFRARQG